MTTRRILIHGKEGVWYGAIPKTPKSVNIKHEMDDSDPREPKGRRQR